MTNITNIKDVKSIFLFFLFFKLKSALGSKNILAIEKYKFNLPKRVKAVPK